MPQASRFPLPDRAFGRRGPLCRGGRRTRSHPTGRWKLVPTGIAAAIPEGYEGQVRPRSGLALKHGIGLLNSPGTIDADYRGEIGIILFNFSDKPFIIQRGDRIAQLVFAQDREGPDLRRWMCCPETKRGAGGFGHTGREVIGTHTRQRIHAHVKIVLRGF